MPASPSPYEALAWTIDPIGPQEFLESYYERRPLVVRRGDPAYYAGLLSLKNVDDLLSFSSLSTERVSVVSGGSSTASEAFAFPSGLVDVARLYQRFQEGGTVIINQVEAHHGPLAKLCRSLEAEMSTRLQANCYLTPAGAKGFRSHYDSHDVLALQVSGSKQWRLFDTPVELPHRGQHFAPEDVRDAACSQEFELHPGDMCYLPRGVMHEAVANDEQSLHITLGILHTTWAELMIEAVARVSLRDSKLRRSLPTGFARPGFDRGPARQAFKTMLEGLRDADFDDVLDHFVDDLISTRHPVIDGQLGAISGLGDITEDTLVGPRSSLLYRISVEQDTVVLHCYGQELVFPGHADEALRFALSRRAYRPSELPGELDGTGALVLVQQLVRAGLVVAGSTAA